MKPLVKVSLRHPHCSVIMQDLTAAGYFVVPVMDMSDVEVEANTTAWDLFAAAAMADGEGVANAADKADKMMQLREERK